MADIQFLTDTKGHKVAVQINLKKYGKLWDDFYDNVLAAKRSKEPRESLESVKIHLLKHGKLNG